jgi:hypothetical protein
MTKIAKLPAGEAILTIDRSKSIGAASQSRRACSAEFRRLNFQPLYIKDLAGLTSFGRIDRKGGSSWPIA